jgi:hypothetical protein
MRKIIKDFSKYTFIGIIISMLVIFFTWLLIDIFQFDTLISTASIVVTFHILKFILYRWIKLFEKQKREHFQFTVYTAIVIFSSLLQIILVWILIDIFHVPTLLSVTTIIAGLFIIRFILFKIFHLIGNNKVQ